jgi:hypothetical protein
MQSKRKLDLDNELLSQHAKELATVLVSRLAPMNIQHYGELLRADKIDISDETYAELQIEEVVFLLHLVGRLSNSMLVPEKRDYFLDTVFSEAQDTLCSKFETESEISAFCDFFGTLYNSRQEEYALYRISLGSDKSKKGELFWEHAKSVLLSVTETNVILLTFIERSGLRTFEFLANLLRERFDGKAKATAEQ